MLLVTQMGCERSQRRGTSASRPGYGSRAGRRSTRGRPVALVAQGGEHVVLPAREHVLRRAPLEVTFASAAPATCSARPDPSVISSVESRGGDKGGGPSVV